MAIATRHDVQIGYAIAPDVFHVPASAGGDAMQQAAQLASRGKVLFHSDFEGGSFDGWRDHQGGFSQYPPIGLTRYPVHAGSHALQVSTGAVPYQAGLVSNNASAYKNMSLIRETGLLSFSGWFSHAGSAADLGAGNGVSFYEWGIALDLQSWDSMSRYFPRLSVRQTAAEDEPHLVLANPQTGAGTTLTGIAGAGSYVAGENERKWNWNYLRMTVDLETGQPLEVQCNSLVYDVRGLDYDPGEPPQAGSAQKSFRGGCNAGIFMSRSIYHTDLIHNVLTADNLVVTVGDQLAEVA